MTPTIEEVKRVARERGVVVTTSKPGRYYVTTFTFTPQELQAFARHYIEVGEKGQREKDARLFETDPSMENFSFIATAIRNNIGE